MKRVFKFLVRPLIWLWAVIHWLWCFVGKDTNHNVLMVIVTSVAVVFAFPYFSRQINNVQVRVDSLQTSIEEIYSRSEGEYPQLLDFIDTIVASSTGSEITVTLKNEPVPGSLSVYLNGQHMSKSNYRLEKDKLTLFEWFVNPQELKSLLVSDLEAFGYFVTYIRSTK